MRLHYVYMYEHFVKDKFGELRVQEIRRSDVRRFYSSMIGEGRNKVAINTLESIHTVVHQVFNIAVEDGFIRTNPSDNMIGEIKRSHHYQTPRRHALDRSQQRALLSYVKGSNKYRHWYPIIVFMLGTGCRISEVISVRWQDIHMDENVEYIDINHNIVYGPNLETGKCEYKESNVVKTVNGARTIPLLAEVKEALIEEKQYQEEVGIKCNCRFGIYTDFVFLNRYGHIHNQQTVNRALKRILKEYNLEEMKCAEEEDREAILLPNFSCHNLRHTFATRCCENIGNIKVIQSVMGYKDIETTMQVYKCADTPNASMESIGILQGMLGHSDLATTMDIYAEATEEAVNESFSILGNSIVAC